MNKPLRFGIIGCSNVAKRRFLPAILKSSKAKLEHIGSRTLEKAKQYASEFKCSKAGSYMDVMNDPDVDVIYISIPTVLRDYWLREAIKRKKHILCEKPAFCDLQSAKEIIDLCWDNGTRIMEGYMFQYHPQHSMVKRLVKENTIGIPKIFTAEYMVPKPDANNIRFNPKLGGGVFLDAVGYLPMAASLQIDSLPSSVYCEKRIHPMTEVDDTVAMMVNFKNGTFGHFSSGYGLQHRSKYSIHGTLGRIEVERAFAVNPDVSTTIILEKDLSNDSIHLEPADQFHLMIEDFVFQVQSQCGDSETSLLRQHVFMESARRSADEHRLVSIEECAL